MGKLMDVSTMDNYYEQIVVKKMSQKKKTMIVIGFILLILVIVASVVFSQAVPLLTIIALAALIGCGYLIYYIISNSKVEYEYTFVGGEMRVERIKRQLRRKKVCAFDVKAVDDIGMYNNPENGERNVDISKHELVLRAESDDLNPDTYYVIIHDKIRHKPAILIFNPDETTLEKIRPFLSIALKKKYIEIQNQTKKLKKNEKLSDKKE